MKFDYCLGNPPYQESKENTSDNPLYHLFINEAYNVSKCAILITPGRFLFNAGKTPKAWNVEMLKNKHLKVLKYEQDSKKVFGTDVDIPGGISILMLNKIKEFIPINTFTVYEELNSILQKIIAKIDVSFSEIVYTQNKFDLDALYRDYPELKEKISSNGEEKRLTSSCFEKLTCFTDEKITDICCYPVLGLYKSNRVWKFINSEYIFKNHPNLKDYKVFLPANNGSHAIGERGATHVIGIPIIGKPYECCTQTFLSIGNFCTEKEASYALKYIKTKFVRCLVGIMKITQNNKKEVWINVPLQDFTENSDIDWSKSIHEIDLQLYKKYDLNEQEISFIEEKIKEMA